MSADATALRAPRSMPWSRVMGLTSVYAKTVRDSRRAALIVGGIGGLFMFITAAPYGAEFTTPEARAALVAQMSALPAVMRGLLGEPINIDTLGGFISWRVGNFLPVLLGLWSVLALSGTLVGEAAKGSLDILVSTPSSRRSIALQKLAGHVTAVVVAMALMAMLVFFAGQAFAVLPGDGIALADAAGFALLTGLLMLACGAVSFAVAPVVGRTRAVAIGLIVLFGGYLIASYGTLSDAIDALSPLTWFSWTAGHRPLAGVTDWPSVGLLALVTIVLLVIGVVAFERRDIGRTAALAWLRLPGLPVGTRGPLVRQLSDRTPIALAWGLGIGLYAALIAASAEGFSTAINELPQMAELIRQLYPDIDLSQPSGLLQLAFYGFAALMLGLAAATAVAGWASEEGDGRLDTVLAAPVSRARWFLSSAIGALLAIVLATAVLGAIVVAAIALAGGSLGDVVPGIALLGLVAMAFAAVGLAAGGLVRSSLAAPVAALFAIGTLVIDLFGPALDLPDAILDLSIVKQLGQPMVGVYESTGVIAAVVLIVGGLAVGAWGFGRRDIDR
jgi:ABC-2 type transport system permease protein